LALESGLPNEVDWAFNKLIKVSYDAPPHFNMLSIPGLVDILLDFAALFFELAADDVNSMKFANNLRENASPHKRMYPPFPTELTVFASADTALQLERTLQVLHVFRNFSFLDFNSHQLHLASHRRLLRFIIRGISLPSYSTYVEIKQHCLDIFDNVATHVVLSGPNDPILSCLKNLLISTDRSLIIGSVRSLTRLCVNESNSIFLHDVDSNVVSRMLQLLLLWDDDITSAVLEYLYMYSSLSPEVAIRMAKACPSNIIRVLVKYLTWQPGGHGYHPQGSLGKSVVKTHAVPGNAKTGATLKAVQW